MTYSPNFRGSMSKGSSRQLQTGYQNGGAGTLLQASPVSTNPAGQIIQTDVSNENSILRFVGLAATDIPGTANGTVIDAGRLEAVTVSFSVGDALWLSKTGFLTNVKPDIGVGGFVVGDFVIFVGVVVQNEFDNIKKDIKLAIEKIGEL